MKGMGNKKERKKERDENVRGSRNKKKEKKKEERKKEIHVYFESTGFRSQLGKLMSSHTDEF